MDGDLPLIERVAARIHATHFREMGLVPIDWDRLRPQDRQRWTIVAEAGIAEYIIGRDAIEDRRRYSPQHDEDDGVDS